MFDIDLEPVCSAQVRSFPDLPQSFKVRRFAFHNSQSALGDQNYINYRGQSQMSTMFDVYIVEIDVTMSEMLMLAFIAKALQVVDEHITASSQQWPAH